MRRFSWKFLVLAAALTAPMAIQAKKTAPSPAEVDAMRQELQERAREHNTTEERSRLVPIEETADAPWAKGAGSRAVLQLVDQMDVLRATVVLTPTDDRASTPTRVNLCFRGEQTVDLAPGRYEIAVTVGRADGTAALHLPARRESLDGRRAFRMTLSEEIEQQFTALLREQEDRAMKDKKKLGPPESLKTGSQARPSAPQATGKE